MFRKRDPKKNEFRYLKYTEFCEHKDWSVDAKELVVHVCNFSTRHDLKVEALLACMQTLPEVDAWQLCVGHDLLGLLGIGLRQALGNQTRDEADMQESFLLAYEEAYLKETAMFRALCVWETRDPRYRIFRRPSSG